MITYLAIPYTHPDPAVREFRFHLANMIAAEMMERGEVVFSPITHAHPIAVAHNLTTEWEFWEKTDRAFLKACEKMVVIMADGWKESKGVAGEIAIADELGIPVVYLEP